MRAKRVRRGMALVAVLAVVGLLAILAVATLSVTTRLGQGTTLAMRDTRLDAAASYGLATIVMEWRQRDLTSLGAGASTQITIAVPGSPDQTSVTVTRLGPELFWIVSEAIAIDASRRRENLVVRLPIPRTDSMPALLVSGDVSLSRQFAVVRDSAAGCAPTAPDLVIGTAAVLSSVDGALPTLTVERRSAGLDSSSLLHIGSLSIAELVATAAVVVPPGGIISAPTGIVHALGDLTVSGGGLGGGVLIVDGRLTLIGPGSFVGLVVARGGITTGGDGMEITGALRTGPAGTGGGSVAMTHQIILRPNACAVQAVVRSAVTPRPVAGRAWTEVY